MIASLAGKSCHFKTRSLTKSYLQSYSCHLRKTPGIKWTSMGPAVQPNTIALTVLASLWPCAASKLQRTETTTQGHQSPWFFQGFLGVCTEYATSPKTSQSQTNQDGLFSFSFTTTCRYKRNLFQIDLYRQHLIKVDLVSSVCIWMQIFQIVLCCSTFVENSSNSLRIERSYPICQSKGQQTTAAKSSQLPVSLWSKS